MAVHHIVILLVFLLTCHVTYAAILRPDSFPYFRDEPKRGVTISPRSGRNMGRKYCPPDISVYECYHELMAAWTRVLANGKRGVNYGQL